MNWNIAWPTENNFIDFLFIFATVTNCTASVFLHGLFSFNRVHSSQSVVIKISTVLRSFSSLFKNLFILGIILLPFPCFYVFVELLFLSGREIYVQKNFIIRLQIPIIILFHVSDIATINMTDEILAIQFKISRVVRGAISTVPLHFTLFILSRGRSQWFPVIWPYLIEFTLEIMLVLFIELFDFISQIVNNLVKQIIRGNHFWLFLRGISQLYFLLKLTESLLCKEFLYNFKLATHDLINFLVLLTLLFD